MNRASDLVWQNGPISPKLTRPTGNRIAVSPSRTLRDAALLIGLVSVLIAGAESFGLAQWNPSAPWPVYLIPGVALVYVATGLAAWLRRPSSRLGFLMVAAGFAWFVAGMANLPSEGLAAVGVVCQVLPLALIVHLLLGFPTGRLQGPVDRMVVASGYFVCLVLQAPLYLFAPAGPLSISDRPELVTAGINVQRVAGALVVLATAWLIWRQMSPMSPERRKVLAPLTVYGIFALLMIPVSKAIADAWFDGGGLTLPVLQLTVMGLVPVGFLLATVRGGFARSGDIAELGIWLGADEVGRPEFGEALASTLGDPSIQLLYHLADEEVLVDGRGVVFEAPGAGSQRAMVEVELAGQPVGAIVYDPLLLDKPDEVREAGRVIALALDRQRLIVELRASRSRIAAASDEERRRIARDLHDGLQARLVFLAIKAGTGSSPDEIRIGIDSAIDELREFVEGVMPVQLAERGLPAAIRDMADQLPIPMNLEVEGLEERLPDEVETAAYFVVSEAVTNAVKHAGSDRLLVSLGRENGRLWIEVGDQGGGGVTTGRGLRSMADRVEALGGNFGIDEIEDGGTRVRAVIPCE